MIGMSGYFVEIDGTNYAWTLKVCKAASVICQRVRDKGQVYENYVNA